MKTLIHNKVRDNIPSSSSRNCYGCIEYTDALKSSSSTQVTFNKGDMDYKRTPFTIRMLTPGKITFLLLPGLPIISVILLVINGQNKHHSKYYTYNSSDINWFESDIELQANDEIRFIINWKSQTYYKRTFGVPSDFYQTEYNFSEDSDFIVGSCIMSTGKYEVFGNLGSLLFDLYDSRWMGDEYDIIGHSTFKYFFKHVDSAYMDNSSLIYAECNNNASGLVSAYNLYLPPLNVRSAYFELFSGNEDLKYGPRRIHVCGKSGYCQYLMENCYNVASDYNVFVTSELVYGENNTMNSMFKNVGLRNGETNKAGTLYYVNREIDNARSSNMVSSTVTGGSFSNYVFSPGGNVEDDYANIATIIGSSGTTPVYKILYPTIWVDDVEAVMYADGVTDMSKYLYEMTQYMYGGRPYTYVGTIWLNDYNRSYYLWKYTKYYDYTQDTSLSPYDTIGTRYILTSEKNFTGMTVEETGKILVHPIKFTGDIHSTSTNSKMVDFDYLDYNAFDLSTYTITKQSDVIPDDEAGVPMLSLDDEYMKDDGLTTINYKHFRNKQYKLIDASLQTDNLWKLHSLQDINAIHTLVNDDDGYDDQRYVLTHNATGIYSNISKQWDLSITFLERGTEMIYNNDSNYDQIETLSEDMQQYAKQSFDNIYLITTNGIKPETCTYIVY